MSTQEERAIQIIEEMEQLIRDGVDEDGEVAEGWLEDWDDVEYRLSRSGRYRGVALLNANYDESGLDVEIDTTRYELCIRDTETEMAVMFRHVENEETLLALRKIDRVWEEEFYREKEQ